MNESMNQPKNYNRFKNYLTKKDINTNKIIKAIKEVKITGSGGGGGDDNYAYGLPIPEYPLVDNKGAFLIADTDGNLSSIGTINDDFINISKDQEDYSSTFTIIVTDNESTGFPINKGRIGINSKTYNNYNISAFDVSGDLSSLVNNPYNAGFGFFTSITDPSNVEIENSGVILLPEYQMFSLTTNGSFNSGFQNGNIKSDSTTESTTHFPRIFVDGEFESWYFGLNDTGYIQYGPNNDSPYYFLPKEHVTDVGKVITSSNTFGNTEWKFIDSDRVKQDTSGDLSIIPDYNEGNVQEYTELLAGTLSIGLPINLPLGQSMTLRFYPDDIVSFTPESSYIFNTTIPADLEANKLVEMTIRNFKGSFYANLIIWE